MINNGLGDFREMGGKIQILIDGRRRGRVEKEEEQKEEKNNNKKRKSRGGRSRDRR